jgi:hypothetical protein
MFLTEYDEFSVGVPIVIERYRSGDSMADQIAFSRSRAILVRQYLQNHFHIAPGNLGVISMKNLPPVGVGHPTWDGICIVIPRKASQEVSSSRTGVAFR